MMMPCAGSVSGDVLAGGGDFLIPPVSASSSSSPVRPLLLRSDVSRTPEEDSRLSRDSSGGDFLLPGWTDPPEEERVYEFPPRVMERLAFGEALSAAHRRERSKRRREDESAELDDGAGVAVSGPMPPRDDGAGGGGGGEADRGSMST